MTGPEWKFLHSALEMLHSRLLYEELGIEHIGYSNELFKRASVDPNNRTLADKLCWILQHGGTLQAVRLQEGRFVGPTLEKGALTGRWLSLQLDETEPTSWDENWAIKALGGLFQLDEPEPFAGLE